MLASPLTNLARPLEWQAFDTPIPYPEAMTMMEERVAAIRNHGAPELVWLLEHLPCYTAGSSAKDNDLITPGKIPLYPTGRGGQVTYHGPGQRIVYLMMDLTSRQIDIRDYVGRLQNWIIASLADFGVNGFCREGRIGVWVEDKGRESKIAAIGIRVRRGVAFHGISVNINPDLSAYAGIIPCGIKEFGVTSLKALGKNIVMAEFDQALRRHFPRYFP
ncbi:MAG: lipoyl(octanoyl) transferase LipB [Dongiaceae bacterium]